LQYVHCTLKDPIFGTQELKFIRSVTQPLQTHHYWMQIPNNNFNICVQCLRAPVLLAAFHLNKSTFWLRTTPGDTFLHATASSTSQKLRVPKMQAGEGIESRRKERVGSSALLLALAKWSHLFLSFTSSLLPAFTAKYLGGVVKGLTFMSPKQLQGVSHLLDNTLVDAIGIAAKIPRSNQVWFETSCSSKGVCCSICVLRKER